MRQKIHIILFHVQIHCTSNAYHRQHIEKFFKQNLINEVIGNIENKTKRCAAFRTVSQNRIQCIPIHIERYVLQLLIGDISHYINTYALDFSHTSTHCKVEKVNEKEKLFKN